MQELQFPTWNLEIGDPTFMGWLTVFAYFSASILSFLVYRNSIKLFLPSIIQQQKVFWLSVAIIMLLLGINKQLDFQSYLTNIGKFYAKRDGWYQNRQIYQQFFIKFIVVMTVSSSVLTIIYLIRTLKDNLLAIFGLSLLASFVAIRASSFHHVDAFINYQLFDVRMNCIFELSGILMVSTSAIFILFRLKK